MPPLDTGELKEIKEVLEGLGQGFEEFKKTNDDRLKELEKKGTTDPITEQKLKKIGDDLDALGEMKKQIEALEVEVNRPRGGGEKGAPSPAQVKHMDAFEAWMRDPTNTEKSAELKTAALELKDITSATSSAGHAIPEIIGRDISEVVQRMSPMRRILDVQQIGSSDYKELVDVNGEDAGWVGEQTTRSATETPSVEQVAPTLGEVYAYPQAYEHILDDAFFDIRSWLTRKVGMKMAELEGEAFISGDGVNKPTGFLNNGAPVATGDFDSPPRAFGILEYKPSGVAGGFLPVNGAASPPTSPGDVFIDAIHSLRPRWRQGAVWVMNTLTKGEIRKFKDSDGNYLLRMGLEAGEGDQVLGYRIEEMDHMPDIAADAFPIAFGNFREGYLAVERTAMRITIDDNITSPGSVKYFVRRRVGGKLLNDQCIKLIRSAAS